VRILTVSAHYPPNFVSGGTLVPERLSRELAARGHEVEVYAGWLGAGRAPLETWRSVDATGLAVRWVCITPFTGWSDEHNFDNPAVAEDFGAYLDETTPDLVHLHSLQTLGAGLVHAVADRGLPVVVTMHDFWWICARQFLCRRDHRPCSLVVDVGSCPCEVDRDWLEDRNAVLATALDRVDHVVAVSEIAATVLEANGVPRSRMTVIENGIPARGRAGSPLPAPTPGLRLAYTGGADPMKGGQVVLEAAAALADLDGWTLSCYGCEAMTATAPQVRLARAFAPAQLDAVLASTDVLVVPSLMRETYSLISREALDRGVPVVTSDSLGPEEVVIDGVNGLVVPSGDAAALAAALRRLIEHPEDVTRLRRTAVTRTAATSPAATSTAATPRAAVTFPTVADQADATEALYRRVVAGRRSGGSAPPSDRTEPPGEPPGEPSTPRRTVRRVLIVAGIDGAPLRYRARLPAEALADLGVEVDVRHYRHPDVGPLGLSADAVVVYRVPATDQVLKAVTAWRAQGVPVLFDVDDLIFDPDLAAEIPALSILPEAEAALWLEGVRRYRTTMEACDGFIGSTEMLCRHATEVVGVPAYRYSNGVGRLLGRLSDDALQRPRPAGPVRIGYLSGTNTHDHDWAAIEPTVIRVLEVHPDTELWLVGPIEVSAALSELGPRVRRLGLQPWSDLPGLLHGIDVNLAPMELGSRFNEAKSAIKWLEAALVATPTVASPTQPFREVVRSGENGILAANPGEWEQALGLLVADPAARSAMGTRAQRDAVLGLAPHRQGRRYLDILETATPRMPPGPGHVRWEAVAHDEPELALDLEPYAVPDPRAEVAVVGAQAAVSDVPGSAGGFPGQLSLVRRSVRDEGMLATARRVARGGWRRLPPRLRARLRRLLAR
jgi:glycosyltransferase involved in cell wall biosynthesis